MDIQRHTPTYKNWHCAAVAYGDLVHLSGVVADDKLLPLEGQMKQVLAKIERHLATAGSNKSRLLTATIYLADLGMKDEMNKYWSEWMDRDNMPARTCVGATLTPNTLIEITVSAVKG